MEFFFFIKEMKVCFIFLGKKYCFLHFQLLIIWKESGKWKWKKKSSLFCYQNHVGKWRKIFLISWYLNEDKIWLIASATQSYILSLSDSFPWKVLFFYAIIMLCLSLSCQTICNYVAFHLKLFLKRGDIFK